MKAIGSARTFSQQDQWTDYEFSQQDQWTDYKVWRHGDKYRVEISERGQRGFGGCPTSREWWTAERVVEILTMDQRDGGTVTIEDEAEWDAVCAKAGEDDNAPDFEDATANARLIAAAPDLLARLSELSEWMRTHTGPSDGTHDMLVRAVAVIAKATGAA